MDETELIAIKDCDPTRSSLIEAPPVKEKQELIHDETVKKKRRRGKSKRKIMKPFMKIPWQNRRKNDNSKRNNRFRKIVLATTHAPFNNNQFLMEIHKPEPENSFQILQNTPGRNRDSSFSVDSEDNYLYSLPEDEEEYLTKEFSSVYEDVENEHLSNMTKNELIQEYLLLKSKYDNLVKRSDGIKLKQSENDGDVEQNDMAVSDKESFMTERDISGTSLGSSATDETSFSDMLIRVKEQEDQIRELQLSNEKLKLENDHLRKMQEDSSSEDSESDSTSTSNSDSSSSRSVSPMDEPVADSEEFPVPNHVSNGCTEETEEKENTNHMVNGFHDPNE